MYKYVTTGILAGFLALSAGPAEALDVRVHDVPVRTVLAGLARSENMNLIIDDTVEGLLTMELADVTAEEAIEVIASSQNLLYSRQGNMAVITAGRENTHAHRSYTWQLQYADPETVRKAAAALVAEDAICSHGDTNSLVFGGTTQEAAALDKLVKELDVPIRQVDVEVEILSLNKDAMKELGVAWNWSALSAGPGHTEHFVYEAQLHALESQGKAKILARPHLLTGNGKEAQILIGDRIPVLTEHISDGEVALTTEYEDAGIKLTYTPRIHADGSVTARLKAEVSTPVLVPDLKAYRITTRRADTEVRMRPGQDLLIGGLINREQIENLRKVPLLGDLPLLGGLFRHRYKSEKETEVVILVRAKVAGSNPLPGEAKAGRLSY